MDSGGLSTNDLQEVSSFGGLYGSVVDCNTPRLDREVVSEKDDDEGVVCVAVIRVTVRVTDAHSISIFQRYV